MAKIDAGFDPYTCWIRWPDGEWQEAFTVSSPTRDALISTPHLLATILRDDQYAVAMWRDNTKILPVGEHP